MTFCNIAEEYLKRDSYLGSENFLAIKTSRSGFISKMMLKKDARNFIELSFI